MKISDLFVSFEDELQLLSSPRVTDPPIVEWKSAFGDLFFRVKGTEPTILWCDLGYTVTPKRPLPAARRTTLAKRVSRAFSGCTFLRVVPFEEEEDWLLVRPRCAVVKCPAQEGGAFWWWNASFPIQETHFQWLSQPQPQLKKWLCQFKNDVPLRMARECARLDAAARIWHKGNAENAEQVRWEQLARAALMLATPATGNKITCIFHASSSTLSVPGVFIPRCLCRDSSTKPWKNWRCEPAELLMQLLQRHIPLPFWRGLDAKGTRSRPHFPGATFDSLSQHEKMEAALLWRDFGREIGKSDGVEAILRALMNS